MQTDVEMKARGKKTEFQQKNLKPFDFKLLKELYVPFRNFYMEAQSKRVIGTCAVMATVCLLSFWLMLTTDLFPFKISMYRASHLYLSGTIVFGTGFIFGVIGRAHKIIRDNKLLFDRYYDVLTTVLVLGGLAWGSYSVYLPLSEGKNPDYLIWAMTMMAVGCFFYTDPFKTLVIFIIVNVFNAVLMPAVGGVRIEKATIYNMLIFSGIVLFWITMKYTSGIMGFLGQQRIMQSQQEKERFLSNITHEMRSPLNAVLMKNDLLVKNAKDEDVRKIAEEIQSYGHILNSLINDVLDSAKIEAGSMSIVPAPYKTKKMISELFGMVGPSASGKNLELKLDLSDNIPSVLLGDVVRIQQVILNLLTNAVKYTKEGSVTLHIDFVRNEPKAGIMNVSVTDTGIGIKEEDLENLASRFKRFDEINNRNIQGTGLGLSITTNLLELMDSELKIESTYGEGSKFYFSLKQSILDSNPIPESIL